MQNVSTYEEGKAAVSPKRVRREGREESEGEEKNRQALEKKKRQKSHLGVRGMP